MTTTALLLMTKILFTGIIGFVPSAKDTHLIRVAAPNARVPSSAEAQLHIAGHVAYLIFRIDDLQPGGRVPDVAFDDAMGTHYGLVWLESEFLSIDGSFAHDPLNVKLDTSDVSGVQPDQNNRTSLRWLFDFRGTTNPVPIDPSTLVMKPDPEKITLRTDLRYGTFAVEPTSIDSRFAFSVDAQNHCHAIARAVSVTLQSEKDTKKATLTITSTPFRRALVELPLKLARNHDDGDLVILIGNEAIRDVPDSTEILTGTNDTDPVMDHYINGAQAHLRFANRLMTPGSVPFIPSRFPVEQCSSGTAPMGPGGKSGGCSPFLLGVADPK